MRRNGLSAMPKVLSGSLKVFYPNHELPELIRVLRDRLLETRHWIPGQARNNELWDAESGTSF